MGRKTYSGSCHCGAVTFTADIDLSEGTHRCNCSFCTKARAWFAIVNADHVHFAPGAEAAQSDYQWTPPGRPSVLHFQFCRTCGVRVAAWGTAPQFGGKFYAVAIASLDGVSRDELAAAPIRYVDGRNDRFNEPPADTRLL